MKYKFDLVKYDFSIDNIKVLFGVNDENIKNIEFLFNCEITGNGDYLSINTNNDNYDEIENVLLALIKKIKNNEMVFTNSLKNKNYIDSDLVFVTTYNGKKITPKTKSQMEYYHLLNKKTIIFAMGSAGSGKTYLAVAYAINMLKLKKIEKIIITRPIVEAGENLGFLPGELKEKVDPYLTPIYDALNEMLGSESTKKMMEKGVIEIAPLAYMRGRTLNDALIILDEAQNTTSIQMKMFLTRLGNNSKMIITGDESQIDLKASVKSGIIVASSILNDIDEIGIIKFSSDDVIRHPLVSKIIKAYEKYEGNL